MTTARRAAHFLGNSTIEFREQALGEVAEGEVRLRVDICALCGSDKRLLAAGSDVVPGHEIAGTVIAKGPNTALPLGTRCIVYIPVFCDECAQCRRGDTNRCLNLRELVGWQRDGGFADVVDVPQRCALPVPDDIPQDIAVLGLDTVGTAAHGLRLALRTQPQPPQRLLVVGCGPLGLGVVAVARAMGVPWIDATDLHPSRLALAKRLGAAAEVDQIAENQYDLVVEVSGAEPAREMAQSVCVPGGAVVVLGESNCPYKMPATPRWRRTDCFTIRSFYFSLTELDENWDLLRGFGSELRDILAHPLKLPDLPIAFEEFISGAMLKPYIISGAST